MRPFHPAAGECHIGIELRRLGPKLPARVALSPGDFLDDQERLGAEFVMKSRAHDPAADRLVAELPHVM